MGGSEAPAGSGAAFERLRPDDRCVETTCSGRSLPMLVWSTARVLKQKPAVGKKSAAPREIHEPFQVCVCESNELCLWCKQGLATAPDGVRQKYSISPLDSFLRWFARPSLDFPFATRSFGASVFVVAAVLGVADEVCGSALGGTLRRPRRAPERAKASTCRPNGSNR